jgi:hypothetical protein
LAALGDPFFGLARIWRSGRAGENSVRDYRVELCVKNSSGEFAPVRAHDFKALDTRDARTTADVWVSDIVSAGAASHLRIVMDEKVLFVRPIDRRVWETLA